MIILETTVSKVTVSGQVSVIFITSSKVHLRFALSKFVCLPCTIRPSPVLWNPPFARPPPSASRAFSQRLHLQTLSYQSVCWMPDCQARHPTCTHLHPRVKTSGVREWTFLWWLDFLKLVLNVRVRRNGSENPVTATAKRQSGPRLVVLPKPNLHR